MNIEFYKIVSIGAVQYICQAFDGEFYYVIGVTTRQAHHAFAFYDKWTINQYRQRWVDDEKSKISKSIFCRHMTTVAIESGNTFYDSIDDWNSIFDFIKMAKL